jgi:lysophospholipase L1-like esterase
MPSAVIIGDSHVDDWSPFGTRLAKNLKAAGYDVTKLGVGATSTGSWAYGKACRPNKSKCVDVETDVPKGADVLLISLGTNDAANAQAAKSDRAAAAAKTTARIKAMAEKYEAKRTIWILPPWQRGNVKHYTQEAMDFLYEVAQDAGVELFDSRAATEALVKGGSGDGVHLLGKGASAWADAVAAQVKGEAKVADAGFPIWPILIAVVAGVVLARRKG